MGIERQKAMPQAKPNINFLMERVRVQLFQVSVLLLLPSFQFIPCCCLDKEILRASQSAVLVGEKSLEVMNVNICTVVFLQPKCCAFNCNFECQILRDLKLQLDVKSSVNIKVTSCFHLPVSEEQLEKFELFKKRKEIQSTNSSRVTSRYNWWRF